jgi:hypothetical protein
MTSFVYLAALNVSFSIQSHQKAVEKAQSRCLVLASRSLTAFLLDDIFAQHMIDGFSSSRR